MRKCLHNLVELVVEVRSPRDYLLATRLHSSIATPLSRSWILSAIATMANLHPATPEPLQDDDSNYGSDFSPEEAQIIESLLSPKFVDIEDNPILNGIEHHGRPSILRLPHALGHEQRSTLFQAARAAERVAEKLSDSVAMGQHYPYREFVHAQADLSD